MAVIQWEYRILTAQNQLTESTLNQLGSEGWEMVGLSSHINDSPIYGSIIEIVCIFKRQKS